MKKICLICKKEFEKSKNESKAYFTLKKRFCSFQCKYVWNSQLNRERGQRPPVWSKGKKKPLRTEEHKRHLSESLKGRKVWNEGKKGLQIGWSKGKKRGPMSLEKKQIHREAGFNSLKVRRGVTHHAWKGGVTPLYKKIRKSTQWKQWRELIFQRDNYICQICGEVGRQLQPNHIKKFSDYPNLRFEVMNGITLCERCHKKWVNHHEEEWESYFNFNLETAALSVDRHWEQLN